MSISTKVRKHTQTWERTKRQAGKGRVCCKTVCAVVCGWVAKASPKTKEYKKKNPIDTIDKSARHNTVLCSISILHRYCFYFYTAGCIHLGARAARIEQIAHNTAAF